MTKRNWHNASPAFKRYWAESASESVLNDYRSGNFKTVRAGDYACNNMHCGTHVRSTKDLRHTGVVLSISWGTAKVRWDDYGWISEERVHELEKVRQ